MNPGANSKQAWCNSIEQQLTDFVKTDVSKPSLHFPVMKRPQRAFVHELTDYFDLRSESLDEEPRRSVVVHRQSNTGIPEPTLGEYLAAQRKSAASASATLNLGSLRRALVAAEQQQRKAPNAILLEQVLGLDEAMLKDVLRPLMRGLVFAVTWIVSGLVCWLSAPIHRR
jgi:transcriptional repressor NF-X1